MKLACVLPALVLLGACADDTVTETHVDARSSSGHSSSGASCNDGDAIIAKLPARRGTLVECACDAEQCTVLVGARRIESRGTDGKVLINGTLIQRDRRCLHEATTVGDVPEGGLNLQVGIGLCGGSVHVDGLDSWLEMLP